MISTIAAIIWFAAGFAVCWVVKDAIDRKLERACLKIVLASLPQDQIREGMAKVAHKEGVI